MVTLENKTKLVELAMSDEESCKAIIAFGGAMYSNGLVKGGIAVAALMVGITCVVELGKVGIEMIKSKKVQKE